MDRKARAEPKPAPPQATGGGFDFFRKYQRVILFTAGIFALVSFSITGALIGFFTPAGERGQGQRMTLPDGRQIRVTEEDWFMAGWLTLAQSNPAVVLPNLASTGEAESLRERLAALRRLAIEFGIEPSTDEVDRAIAQALEVFPQFESESALASGFGSVAQYRKVLGEALRVATFLRLETAAVDTSDAALAAHLLEGQEMVTVRVAALDRKPLEEELKEQGASEEDLRAWIEELPPEQRASYEDRNRVSLAAAGLRYDQFDESQFTDELEGFELDDAKLRQEYEVRKVTHFRKPKPPGPPDGSGQAPKEGEQGGEGGAPQTPDKDDGESPAPGGAGPAAQEPTEPRQPPSPAANETTPPAAEGSAAQEGAPAPTEESQQPQQGTAPAPTTQAGEGEAAAPTEAAPVEGETTAPQEPQEEYLPFDEVRPQLERMLRAEAALDAIRNGPLQERQAAHMAEAIEARNKATIEVAQARRALAEAERARDEEPEDEAKKEAVAAAQQKLEQAEQAASEAEKAVDERRASFDFLAVMKELIGDRAGYAQHVIEEPTSREGLKDLGPLGTWENAFQAESMDAAGDISTRVERTGTAAFHFQVPEIVEKPLKPFDQIAEQARKEYFAKKAEEIAKKDVDSLEAALLEKAKARIPEEIAKLEQENAEGVAKEFEEWKAAAQKRVEEAEAILEQYADRQHFPVYGRWQAELEKRRDALAKAEEKRAELQAKGDEEMKAATEKAAAKVYADVLAEAVEGTRFEIRTIGPYTDKLSSRPRFAQAYPADVRFLWGNETVTGLEPREVTDVLDDTAERVFYLAVGEAREPATIADLTRRELVTERQRFAQDRLSAAFEQSFTIDALKKRWNYETLQRGEEEVVEPADGETSEK